MRREFIQALAVFAIALGAGLFAFGRHLDPPVDVTNPASVQRAYSIDERTHASAAVACGLGVCLMTFGGLAIAIPWLNDVFARRSVSAASQQSTSEAV
jgi:hypothetical protein